MAEPMLYSADADTYSLAPAALLIADGTGSAAAETLQAAGLRILARVGTREGAAALAARPAVDVVALESAAPGAGATHETLAELLPLAEAGGARLVVTVREAEIDAAAALMLGRPHQLLCAPSAADRIVAYTLAAIPRDARLNDAARDSEAARLRRLNEEVARIADALAQLTRDADAPMRGDAVRDPGSGYRGPDSGPDPDASAQEIRSAIRARRLRAQFFAPELFADPAWDMLLDLFAAELEARRVSVSSLCIAAAVPPTTALRWIGTMHDAGLFERHADPSDRRRAYIALSSKARDGMRGYIAAAKRQGLAIV